MVLRNGLEASTWRAKRAVRTNIRAARFYANGTSFLTSCTFLGRLCKQKTGWNVNSNRLQSEIMLGRLRLRALEE